MIEPEIGVPAKRVNGRMWRPGDLAIPMADPLALAVASVNGSLLT